MGADALLQLALPLLLAAPRAMPFQAQVLPVTDERGTRVRVFVGVSHRDLQFVKEGDSYAASFRVTVEAREKKSAIAVAEDWEASRRTSSYAATVSPTAWRTTCRTIHLDPGRYGVTIQVKDLSSDRIGQLEREVDLAVADSRRIAVHSFLVEKGTGGCKTTRPFWGQRQPETLSLLCHLWAPDTDSATVLIRIVDPRDNVTYDREVVMPVSGRARALDLAGVDLPPGHVEVRVEARADNRSGTSETHYHVIARGVPSGEQSLDLMARQMRSIMEPEAYEALISLPPEEKKEAFEIFWSERDPTPSTDENELLQEFFRRVEVVDQEFATGATPGWETDRGRIYLVYGRPDERKRFASGRFQEKLHEVWRYYELRRRFVFVDELGDGNFVLVSSS